MTQKAGYLQKIGHTAANVVKYSDFQFTKRQLSVILVFGAGVLSIVGLFLGVMFSGNPFLSLIAAGLLITPLLVTALYLIWPEVTYIVEPVPSIKRHLGNWGRLGLGFVLLFASASFVVIVFIYSISSEIQGYIFPDIRVNIFSLLGDPMLGFLALMFIAGPITLLGASLIANCLPKAWVEKFHILSSKGRLFIAIFGGLFLLVSIFSSGIWIVFGNSLWEIIIRTLTFPLFSQGILMMAILSLSFGLLYAFSQFLNRATLLNETQRVIFLALLAVGFLFYVTLILGLTSAAAQDVMNFLTALLKHQFLQTALITAFVVGVVSSVIGVFILLRGIIFLGQAIAHSAFAGAALAVLLKVNPLFPIMIFSVASSLGIGYVNEKKIMRSEVVIGVIFSFFMAIAVFFIGLIDQYTVDVQSILFGNILLTSQLNLMLLLFFSTLVLLVLFFTHRGLFFMTFDEEMAKISGIPVRALNYLFLILVSLTISVSLRAIGAILVFAMIVTPAAAAYQWTYRINRMFFLSAIFGVFSTVVGLYFSFVFDLPSGSTIVVLITLLFILSFVFSPKRLTHEQILEECPVCKDHLGEEDLSCLNEDCPGFGIPHRHKDEVEVKIKKDDIKTESPTQHDHH